MKKQLSNYSVLTLFILLFAACQSDTIDDSMELYKSDAPELTAAKSSSVMGKGFNAYGFNWNAHHFNGNMLNVFFSDTMFQEMFFYGWDPYTGDDAEFLAKYPVAEYLPFWGFRHFNLVMHWNEACISRDGIYPETWFDSNAWITFHYSGELNGSRWSQFQKYVAARSTDYKQDGKWYNENDEEIGLMNDWGDLILIQVTNTGELPEIFYDSYVNPYSSGIGAYKTKK